MSSAPFMQLYPADYLADTMGLTTEQHGAYLLILMTMWRHDAKLPNDPAKLARIARVSARRWHLVWAEIEHFFYVDGDHIRNNRMDREHQKASSISQKRSASGAAGGAAKALKDKEARLASAMRSPQHSQISEPDKKKTEAKASAKKPDPDADPPPQRQARRAAVIPPDWAPSDRNISDARDRQFTEQEIRDEAERFRDYHIAHGTTFKDWDAGWRTWLGNARRFAPRRPMARGSDNNRGQQVGGILGAVLRSEASGTH